MREIILAFLLALFLSLSGCSTTDGLPTFLTSPTEVKCYYVISYAIAEGTLREQDKAELFNECVAK